MEKGRPQVLYMWGTKSEFEVWDDTGRNKKLKFASWNPLKTDRYPNFLVKINTLIDFTLKVYLHKLKVIREHDSNLHHIENVPDIVDFFVVFKKGSE